jgi:hypothetical protein
MVLSRMRRDIGMQHPARGVFHDDKDIEEPRGRRDHDAEVARDDRLGLIADKGPPALERDTVVATTVEVLGHILAPGAWRHAEAKRQEQFVGDPLLVIVQGVVRSGDRRWQAFFSQGPVAGAPQSGLIFRSTPPCSWYTHAALIMPRCLFEDFTICWGARQRGGGDPL